MYMLEIRDKQFEEKSMELIQLKEIIKQLDVELSEEIELFKKTKEQDLLEIVHKFFYKKCDITKNMVDTFESKIY
jgi:hypothetical protein